MLEKTKFNLAKVGATITGMMTVLSFKAQTLVSCGSADDVFNKIDEAGRSTYDRGTKIAIVVVAVVFVIACLIYLISPSSKGAEKGKSWIARILAGVIMIAAGAILIKTLIDLFGGGKITDLDITGTILPLL